MKDEFDVVIVIEFAGLKSKMHSLKKIDGKECNTARVMSIATEFDKWRVQLNLMNLKTLCSTKK